MPCLVRLSPLQATQHVWLLPLPLLNWKLRLFRMHCLRGWFGTLLENEAPSWLVFGDRAINVLWDPCDRAINVLCETLVTELSMYSAHELLSCYNTACTGISDCFWNCALSFSAASHYVASGQTQLTSEFFPLPHALWQCSPLYYSICWMYCEGPRCKTDLMPSLLLVCLLPQRVVKSLNNVLQLYFLCSDVLPQN